MRDKKTKNIRFRIGLLFRKEMLNEIEWLMCYANKNCEFDAVFFHHIIQHTPYHILPDWETAEVVKR